MGMSLIAWHSFSRGSPHRTFTTTITPFCLATVFRMSNVSVSGFAPYFFAIVGSEKSERGINGEPVASQRMASLCS
uniref:Uncharacterized protein n=1 Tax=Arundo donax TaxID=35708 RepID=A0A0A9E3B1_ARUDO